MGSSPPAAASTEAEPEARLRQVEDALEERTRLAAVSAEISSALVQGGEALNVTLQRCAHAIVRHLDAAFARIWMLDPGDDILQLRASAGLYTHLDGPHGRIKVGEFKIGRIARNAEPLFTNDVPNDPNISSPDWARREGMVAFAGYPLILNDRVVGVLAMFARHAFSDLLMAEMAPIASNIAQWMKRMQTEDALQDARLRLQATLAASEVATWVWDVEHDRIFADPNLTRLYEIAPEDAAGGPIAHFIEAIHPDDRALVRDAVEKALLDPVGEYETHYRVGPKSGYPRWVTARGKVERDATGKIVRFPGVVIDITSLKKAEADRAESMRREQDALREMAARSRELQESNAQLREIQAQLGEANALLADKAKQLEQIVENRTLKLRETIAELEAFSYSISHDMRSPLRAMQGYAEALLQDYRGSLNEEAVHYLDRIYRGAHRLDLLIRDVLAYSRVSRESVALSPVPLKPLILEIVQNYPDLHASCLNLTVADLPVVRGHESLLTQIVSNLLGNAVKFTRPGVFPVVHVYAEPQGEMVRLWFEDNGLGVAPQHHEQIFQIFGRVYPESSYQGTGIGLAIVKKAAQRMGGTAGLESKLGEGSRFWVTLQAAR
jgi:PAS domain S-box-containing protein